MYKRIQKRTLEKAIKDGKVTWVAWFGGRRDYYRARFNDGTVYNIPVSAWGVAFGYRRDYYEQGIAKYIEF